MTNQRPTGQHKPEARKGGFDAVSLFGAGLRNPSGPAVYGPRLTGRTHDRSRSVRQIEKNSCIKGAVHTCGVVDHGSHKVLWPFMQVHETRLVYVHFHHKSFARFRRTAMEKLAPFVDVNDAAALAAFRGPGAHLVLHLQKTEAEYKAIMTPDSRCLEFPAFCERLVALEIDPGFCAK